MSKMVKVELPVEQIRSYCETQPILRLSVLAPEYEDWLRPDTDIGLLVDYVPEAAISLFDLVGQEIDLSEIIGRKVDLATSKGLSRGSLQEFVDSARLIYAKKFGE